VHACYEKSRIENRLQSDFKKTIFCWLFNMLWDAGSAKYQMLFRLIWLYIDINSSLLSLYTKKLCIVFPCYSDSAIMTLQIKEAIQTSLFIFSSWPPGPSVHRLLWSNLSGCFEHVSRVVFQKMCLSWWWLLFSGYLSSRLSPISLSSVWLLKKLRSFSLDYFINLFMCVIRSHPERFYCRFFYTEAKCLPP